MKIEFIQGNLLTEEEHKINSLILEKASDVATKLTELECELSNITCYDENDDCISFTEEAQDIFNDYYDMEVDSLYELLNNQLKEIDNRP